MEVISLPNGVGHEQAGAAISRELITLQKRYFGRGPVSVRTHVLEDSVVVLFHGGSMAHEQALVEPGRSDLVMEVRDAINDAIRLQYVAVIERVLGRKVVGFMAGNQHEPDLGCHVYVLAQSGKPPGDNGSAPSSTEP